MSFALDDFREQVSRISRLGSLQKILGRIPGMEGAIKQFADLDVENGVKRMLGIVDSMTDDEKRNPIKVLDQGRRRRIAVGAGVELYEVNETNWSSSSTPCRARCRPCRARGLKGSEPCQATGWSENGGVDLTGQACQFAISQRKG